MDLGNFSVSLAVKDIKKSKEFYEKLGFQIFGGDITQNWLILKNGSAIIGLFENMFEGNILTFNPGWNAEAQTLEQFTDVRIIQKQLKEKGIALENETNESGKGPGSIVLLDPDENQIFIDQHV